MDKAGLDYVFFYLFISNNTYYQIMHNLVHLRYTIGICIEKELNSINWNGK